MQPRIRIGALLSEVFSPVEEGQGGGGGAMGARVMAPPRPRPRMAGSPMLVWRWAGYAAMMSLSGALNSWRSRLRTMARMNLRLMEWRHQAGRVRRGPTR